MGGGITTWTAVTANNDFSCGIASKRLYCWGYNYYGQLGDGTTTNRHAPTQVSGTATGWTGVSAGFYQTCGTTKSGRLYCWGYNSAGQLGDGTTTNHSTPTQVAGTGWSSVSSADYFTCGRKKTKRIYCWGANSDGELGTGDTQPSTTPKQVVGSGWSSLSSGDYHSCARKSTGRVYCWGSDVQGQLGDGTTNSRSAPIQVGGGTSDWAAVDAGTEHTCARKKSGRVYCWGYNGVGQLGDGTHNNSLIPVQLYGGATDWSLVDAGSNSCALTKSGRAYCWGYNSSGQLGDGTTTTRYTPTELDTP